MQTNYMRNNFGKGIESLIPKKGQEKVEEKIKKEAVFYIEVEKIKSNPYQPRKQFDLDALKALSDSIREYGILQPLIVSKLAASEANKEGMRAEYQLIAGERRLMASRMIGLTQVPVIIRKPNNKEKLELSLIENIQRLDLNPMEKAEAYDRLNKEFDLTHTRIAEMAGVSRETISNCVRLIGLSDEVKETIREGKLSEGHARAILLAKEPEKQKVVFQKILKDGLNVRETEYLAKKLNIWQPLKGNLKVEVSDHFKDLEMKFKEIFGISAKTIKFALESGRPKLTIIFDSQHEAEKLIKKIG